MTAKTSLVEFVSKNIPHYAVLSHTWGADGEKVTFKDILDSAGKSKAGYSKIASFRDITSAFRATLVMRLKLGGPVMDSLPGTLKSDRSLLRISHIP
ncbi:hypothetical protein K469DRAFT_254181 [Zopfia rhizophila CBS 207.26]|uniref:Heterokaryon incompatibility domain-containing protein n=1 Tax=Zopfia rhizophila CBS 207.26 TaxID=1314779 RepID=A0A6A6DRG6_9PEZI|nr:hypothetical protein K469DRAFT_254181 [Zopfia rhizophila CBS 207.26]